MMQKNLTLEIENYISSVGEVHEDGVEYQKSKPKKIKSRDKIVALLTDNNKLSAVALAERIGISTKAVEKHLSNLKADGIIKRIGPAEIVAAAQALSGTKTMSVDVEADEDSDVLLVKTDRILSPCENACAFHARLVRNLMRTLAVKTIELNHKIEILSHRSTQDRLMAYLRSVAQQKGTDEFDIPFDRQQLADFLCVERSALSAEISRLSKLGLIMSRKNHFALHQNPKVSIR